MTKREAAFKLRVIARAMRYDDETSTRADDIDAIAQALYPDFLPSQDEDYLNYGIGAEQH